MLGSAAITLPVHSLLTGPQSSAMIAAKQEQVKLNRNLLQYFATKLAHRRIWPAKKVLGG